MADVVRSGAIFRVREAAALELPPELRSSSSRSAAPTRVRRVVVSSLEAASSVDTSRVQSSSARRRKGNDGAALLPETPVGMPKRKARLQQTPNLRKKLSARTTIERTPEEIEASFNQLVMNTTLRKKSSSARRANSSNSTSNSTTTPRRTRSQSVSSSASSSTASPVEIAPASSSRVTRSATKARQQELAPAASPASSVQTQILESTEEDEEDDEPDNKTPPTKRKTQAKRPRADEPPSTSVRSSKRLRAQQRLLSSLPPARAPVAQMGNTEEDEELLQIQKRLVFGKSRKPKASTNAQQEKKQQTGKDSSNADDSTADEDDNDTGGDDESAEQVRVPRSSPRRRSDQKQRLSASFSILEDVEALPKAKKSSILKENSTVVKTRASKSTAGRSPAAKIVLRDWTPQWPPPWERTGGSSGQKKQQIQLVFEGQAEGRDAIFQIARRVSATEFVSTTNEHVELDGFLDDEKAKARGVPDAVVEILGEGLPSNWRQKLRALLNSKTTPKR